MGHCGDLLGEVERVVVAVGWRDEEIAQGKGFDPAKSKTERDALSISLVLKQIVWVTVGAHWVREKG